MLFVLDIMQVTFVTELIVDFVTPRDCCIQTRLVA